MANLEMLPEPTAGIIRAALADAETLEFGGAKTRWHSLRDFRSFENDAAIYAVGLKLGVTYPRLTSKIVYFGSTATLRNRMRSYAGGGHNDRLSLLHKRFPDGLECCFHLVPGLDLQWRRAFEDAALQTAFAAFGCYPLCNMAPIDSMSCHLCREFIAIAQCEGLPFPQGFSTLNCGDGLLENYPLERPNLDRRGGRRAVQVEISVSNDGSLQCPSLAEIQREMQEHVQQPEIEETPWITQDHVIMWSEQKMRRLLAICARLKQAKIRGKTQVITFDAPTARAPSPDTWGEIALIKAREITGTFYPETRTWVKVRHGKVLLGQAILEPKYYRGEDKSDLPQTKRRDTIWRNAGWLRELKSINGEVPDDFRPQKVEIPPIQDIADPAPNIASHLNFLRKAREFDVKEATRQFDWEQQMAIERDKYAKGSRLLDERIEARYKAATEIET